MRIPETPSLAARLAGLALSVCLLGSTLRAETQAPDAKAVEAPKNEATATPVAIGAAVGTAGYGPFVIVTASENFTVTLGYTFFDYTYNTSSSDADYNGKLKLSNVQGIVNWHPFGGAFHLSAGGFLSNNKVSVTGKPNANSTYTINNTVYTGAQVGSITGNVELAKSAVPYIGLGWAKKPLKSGFACFADIGVIFTPSAQASLSANGPIASDTSIVGQTFQTNLRQEETKVNNDLKPLRYYPIVQVGLMYRF
jgi:hypothetical protein